MGPRDILLFLSLNTLVSSVEPIYSTKYISYCPLVTLDGNISNFQDSQAYNLTRPMTMAECSLVCTSRQTVKCNAFTHYSMTNKCSMHYNLPSSTYSVTQISIENPTTHLMLPRRLYGSVHISSCLFPFTLNGTMFRESCAVNYKYSSNKCNTAMFPALFHDEFNSQPHAEWVICRAFEAKNRFSMENKNISCKNSSIIISTTLLLPSKWILVQSRFSVTGTSFNQSWKDFKNGFNISDDYWIGNEALHLLTSMKCSDLFDELPVSTKTTFVPSSLSPLISSPTSSSSSSSLTSSVSLTSPSSSLPFYSTSMESATLQPSTNSSTSHVPKQKIRYEIKISKYWRLRIELQNKGRWYSVEYNSVAIDTEHNRYSMSVNKFDKRSSDAGDGFNSSSRLPFVISSKKNGWWDGGTGSLNSFEPSWPDSDGNLFHPRKVKMFIQPVSRIFNVTVKYWI